MNKYTELKAQLEKEINSFPMAFAFSNEQFKSAMEKLNVSSPDELLSLPSGGMIRKIDRQAYRDMMKRFHDLTNEMEKDDEYLYQGFIYELANHEYGYTYDPTDTLAIFGLTPDDLEKDERIKKLFKKAVKEHLAGFIG